MSYRLYIQQKTRTLLIYPADTSRNDSYSTPKLNHNGSEKSCLSLQFRGIQNNEVKLSAQFQPAQLVDTRSFTLYTDRPCYGCIGLIHMSQGK